MKAKEFDKALADLLAQTETRKIRVTGPGAYGVTLPALFRQRLMIGKGDYVDMTFKDDAIVVRKSDVSKRTKGIDELLAARTQRIKSRARRPRKER